MQAFGFLVALVAFLLTLAAEFVMAQRLVKHRTDIDQGRGFWRGGSWFSQLNVSSKRNYDSEGRRKLRVLHGLAAVRGALLLIAFVFFILAFVI